MAGQTRRHGGQTDGGEAVSGWAIASILYILPILVGIRQFHDVVDDCKDWMRSDDGEWFPALAPYMAVLSLILWPLVYALDAIAPKGDQP